MSLPRSEQVRVAGLFMEHVWPQVEAEIDAHSLRHIKQGTADLDDIRNGYKGVEMVKTALRRLTTPDRKD